MKSSTEGLSLCSIRTLGEIPGISLVRRTSAHGWGTQVGQCSAPYVLLLLRVEGGRAQKGTERECYSLKTNLHR